MIELAALTDTTIKMMDGIEALEKSLTNPKLLAVAIVAVVEGVDEEGDMSTFTRTYFSESIHYRQLGLLYAGLRITEDGNPISDES